MINTYRLFTKMFVCIVILYISPYSINAVFGAEDMNVSKDKEKLSLLSYLKLFEDAFDVHFTIEEAYLPGKIQNRISSSLILMEFDSKSITNSIDFLQKSISGIIIIRNKNRPEIFHIIDKNLDTLANYPINKIVDSISYNGAVGKLIDVLKIKVPSIMAPTSLVSMNGPIIYDMKTCISFSVTNKSVRDILSNHIPIRSYSTVLWIAETELISQKTTTIQFLGPKNK